VLAIVSLVTAFIVSLAAIITGHIALAQIKRTGEKGRGLALAGVILGYAGIALGTLVIVANILLAVAAATSGEYTGAY
jgi:heme A synthase